MRGLIAYSSRRDNTKAFANYLYQYLKEDYNLDLKEIQEVADLNQYDFILLGCYRDRGFLNKESQKALKKIKGPLLGIFANDPLAHMTNQRQEFACYLEGFLVGRPSLGVWVCPGRTSQASYEKAKITPNFLLQRKRSRTRELQCRDKSFKGQLLEGLKTSRPAKEEELQEALDYFKDSLSNRKVCSL